MTRQVDRGLQAIADRMSDCEAERRGIELYGAPRFSVIQHFREREHSFSDMFADLLDRDGSHGQGPLFLETLLSVLGLPGLDAKTNWTVQREAPMRSAEKHGRLDIKIGTDSFLLGIEVKVNAKEGDGQLSYYASVLQNRAGSADYALVLLGQAKPVDAHSAVLHLPYWADEQKPSVAKWLSLARENVRASNVRDFLDDVLQWIDNRFRTSNDRRGLDPYMNEIVASLSDPDKAQAIGAVLSFRQEVYHAILDEMDRLIRTEFPDMTFSLRHAKNGPARLRDAVSVRHNPLVFRKSNWPANCYLAVGSDENRGKKICYGVQALSTVADEVGPERICAEIEPLDHIMRELQFSDDDAEPWWRGYKYLPSPDWSKDAVFNVLCTKGNRYLEELCFGRLTDDLKRIAVALDEEFPAP